MGQQDEAVLAAAELPVGRGVEIGEGQATAVAVGSGQIRGGGEDLLGRQGDEIARRLLADRRARQLEIADDVVAFLGVARVEDEAVAARAAGHDVVAGEAGDRVVALGTDDHVVVLGALKVARAFDQPVEHQETRGLECLEAEVLRVEPEGHEIDTLHGRRPGRGGDHEIDRAGLRRGVVLATILGVVAILVLVTSLGVVTVLVLGERDGEPFAGVEAGAGKFEFRVFPQQRRGVEREHVVCGEIDDDVIARGRSVAGEDEGVGTLAATRHVAPRTAVEPIVPGVAEQAVVALATADGVIAVTGLDQVVAGEAVDRVVHRRAEDPLVRIGAGDGRIIAADDDWYSANRDSPAHGRPLPSLARREPPFLL